MIAWTGILIALALGALVWGVRRKLRRDAITQNGAILGSAMLAQLVSPDITQARFVIVRGEPKFDAGQPFEHRSFRFRILSYDRIDESSIVLRRFLDVVCAVELAGKRMPASDDDVRRKTD